ncbi:hypothetical protein SteCoe_29786 [Stentor coeruleus]|uniref:Uncharacterized protein n=1 Tax=Stentor coeruleus TaxID=5963 RepID=A0A1R2B540_9CILI|nr:hypothetical protein SteCoe_29786 [Stentor coeruleus]
MGQKKGLIYNCLVISFFICIVVYTTKSSGYSRPILPDPIPSSSPHFFPATTFHLIISSPEPIIIPDSIKYSIKSITNAYSQFWPLEVILSQTISLDPSKIITSTLTSNLSKNLVFNINPIYQSYKKNGYYWIQPEKMQEIVNVFVRELRRWVNFPEGEGELVNGLTKNELENGLRYYETWLDSELAKEVKEYNKVNEINNGAIPEDVYMEIIKLSGSIGKTNTVEEKHKQVIIIKGLNRNTSLGVEDYFQWDFKLGVYAPFFFPVIFPMTAAIYSRLFLRK